MEALLESVQLVKAGTAPKIVQDLTQGEYEPICKRMVIDWTYPIGVVYNVIRGCNPSPGAVTTFNGQEFKVFDCERRPESGAAGAGHHPGDHRRRLPGAGLRRAASSSSGCSRRAPARWRRPSSRRPSGLKVGDRLG